MNIYVVCTSSENLNHILESDYRRVKLVESVDQADLILILHRSALVSRIKTFGKPTIFISFEPDEAWHGAEYFLAQFNLTVTSDARIHIQNHIIHPSYTTWLFTTMQVINDRHVLSIKTDKPVSVCRRDDKAKRNICLITSNKSWTAGHQKRLKIVAAIMANEDLKDIVDVYGHGFRPLGRKFDVLKEYDSVIIIENQEKEDYWTEKLADSIILEQNIFYIGCQNIYKFFYEENIKLAKYSENIEDYINAIIKWSKLDAKYIYGNQKVKANRRRVLEDYGVLGLVQRFSDHMILNKTLILKPAYEFSDNFWRCSAKKFFYCFQKAMLKLRKL